MVPLALASMFRITDLDRRLIAVLRKDGRMPIASLAEELGVSRTTVSSRIEKLTAAGVILGFTVKIRQDADVAQVRAVSFIEVAGTSTDWAIDQLRGFPELHALHTTNGAWDLVAEIACADLRDLDHVLRRIRSVKGVLNSETSVLLSSVVS